MAFGSTGGGVGAGAAGAPAGPAARPRPPRPPPPLPACQMPEKSIFPSAVRGGGPVSTGLPSRRGTSGVGKEGHWAWTETERAAAIARAPVTRVRVISISGGRVYQMPYGPLFEFPQAKDSAR